MSVLSLADIRPFEKSNGHVGNKNAKHPAWMNSIIKGGLRLQPLRNFLKMRSM